MNTALTEGNPFRDDRTGRKSALQGAEAFSLPERERHEARTEWSSPFSPTN
jgi:hypothetical protein